MSMEFVDEMPVGYCGTQPVGEYPDVTIAQAHQALDEVFEELADLKAENLLLRAQLRHPELGSAEDEALWKSDIDYLKNLAEEVYDVLDGGGFLWEMPLSVEGHLFWLERGPEPTDEAAVMLADWKHQLRRAA